MQNPHSVWRMLLVAVAGLAILVVSGFVPVHYSAAQGSNLLQNGGFEGQYVPFQGDNTRLVAPGWTPWAVPHKDSDPGFVNLPPEYRPAANHQRVRSGSSAQEWFTFFATHTGGVLQRVASSKGAVLQFSVWVNVWSTSLDDPNTSEQPGRVTVKAGIDPFGGTDGTSPNIVWTTAPELYDQYQQITVSATAASQFVTVFIQSSPKDPVKNNNVYADDASLVATGQSKTINTQAPAPTNTNVPPTAISAQPTSSNPFEPTREGTIIPGPSDTPGGVIISLPTATFLPGVPTITPVPITSNNPGSTSNVVYTVVAGDTLIGLAAHFNTTVDAIAAANGLDQNGLIFVGQQLVIPVPATPTPVPPQAPSSGGAGQPTALPPVDSAALTGPTVNGIGTYIVQPGDDFTHIAQHYGLSVNALAQLNGIVNPNTLPLGTVLVVPGAGNNVPGGSVPPTVIPTVPPPPGQKTHTVVAGENLFRISLKYGVTLDALMRANGIINPNLVYVGQVLRIP